jgi:bifunctional UDP-N-acetylglucosamine pyrophosphorylase / glucosamine-1-phosphate N-acetyltransferase
VARGRAGTKTDEPARAAQASPDDQATTPATTQPTTDLTDDLSNELTNDTKDAQG